MVTTPVLKSSNLPSSHIFLLLKATQWLSPPIPPPLVNIHVNGLEKEYTTNFDTSTHLARVDVSDHVMNSVPIQVDNVHLALPVLLHVVCEHGVKDCGSRCEDILVATELPTLTGHYAVGKLALKKTN